MKSCSSSFKFLMSKMSENTMLNSAVGAFFFPEISFSFLNMPFRILVIWQAACVYVFFFFSFSTVLPTQNKPYFTDSQMSPLGVEDVVHGLQHHVTQPAEMLPVVLSSWPLLDSVFIIRSLAKSRITRTSSKNIIPVWDTGHLLACPYDRVMERRGGVRRRRRGGGKQGVSGWD